MSQSVLIVKTSSLGDIIHTLPAVTDAVRACSGMQFDWVVEETYQAIPAWHPHVRHVLSVALRRWRKNIWQAVKYGEVKQSLQKLRAQHYDVVIDAQGLLKSAVISLCARGQCHSYDRHSSRSPGSAWLYHKRYPIAWQQHAVQRVRQLFAKVLNYKLPQHPPDYGIRARFLSEVHESPAYLLFLPSTTWSSKLWPEAYWRDLIDRALAAGFGVKLSGGNRQVCEWLLRMVEGRSQVDIISPNLTDLAHVVAGAAGVVTVDTGIGHLAIALERPTVAIYGASDPVRDAVTYMPLQRHLKAQFPCAPCFKRVCLHPAKSHTIYPPCYTTVPPLKVWQALQAVLTLGRAAGMAVKVVDESAG